MNAISTHRAQLKAIVTYVVTSILLATAWQVHFLHGLWVLNAVAALLGIGLAHDSRRDSTRQGAEWSPRSVSVGVILGVGLAIATHGLAYLVLPRWRGLELETRRLYGMIDDARSSLPALAVVLLVVVAEELVYRGVVTTALAQKMRYPATVICSVALYSLPLCASGSWLLVAMGLTLGTLWTLTRLWTNGLTVSLISHAIWSSSTFVLFPIL